MCRPLQKTMLHRGLGDPTGQVLLRHPTTGKWRSGESEGWRFVLVGKVQGPKQGILMNFGPCSETCGKFKHIENVRFLVRSAHPS